MPYQGKIEDIPKGWALCDGTNETPNLSGRFLEGVTSSPGSTKSAGLPNIKGDNLISNYGTTWYPLGQHGAFNTFTRTVLADLPENSSRKSNQSILSFDASKYNSIYNDLVTTVQPASYTVLYIIKIKK